MKKLKLTQKEEILAQCKKVWGNLGETATIPERLPMPYALKYMRGCIATIQPVFSLCKSYGYQKEYGYLKCQHNGKEWFFVSAHRGTCFSGGSIGGTQYCYPATSKEYVTLNLYKRENIFFS